MEPYDWFTDLIHMNYIIDNICCDFIKTDNKLSMHIMDDMCDEYNQLKLFIERRGDCSSFLENLVSKAGIKSPALETWGEKILRIWFNKLAQFGRIGYVANKENIK